MGLTRSDALLRAVEALDVVLAGVQVSEVGGRRRVATRDGLVDEVRLELGDLPHPDLLRVAGILAVEGSVHLAARRGARGARRRLEGLRLEAQVGVSVEEPGS